MRSWTFAGLLFLVACGGSSDKTGSTSTGGTGGTGGSTGGSGGRGGGSGGSSGGGSGGVSAGGGTGGVSVGGSAGSDAGTFTCSDGGTVDAGAEAAIAAACVVAVVKVTRIDEECSGAGGAHISFDVVKLGRGSATSVRYGGHAYYAPPEGPDNVGEFFVAGIDPLGALTPQPDNPGWCIVGLPAIDGIVHTLIEASDEADATAKMNTILGI